MKSDQCYAPLASTISILTLSRPGFFWFSGVGGGRNLPAANISKTIRCMPMKFSQVDGLVKLEYTLQFCCHGNKLWRHYDVIGQKNSDYSCCSVNVHRLLYLPWCCVSVCGLTFLLTQLANQKLKRQWESESAEYMYA